MPKIVRIFNFPFAGLIQRIVCESNFCHQLNQVFFRVLKISEEAVPGNATAWPILKLLNRLTFIRAGNLNFYKLFHAFHFTELF
jgi:hypothetical protein